MDLIYDRDFQHEMLAHCYKRALQSPDPSTQNAAVIVDDTGPYMSTLSHNEFPHGVEYTGERWQRPLKYSFIEHAERNSVYLAAKRGLMIDGKAMVSPWAACTDCARAIIQSGLVALITHQQAHDLSPQFWLDSIKPAMAMFDEAGVEVIFYDGRVRGAEPLLHSGTLWTP